MKKIISLVLALVMALSFTLVLTSCGDEPELDFATAKTNLEAAGYSAKILDSDVELMAIEYPGIVKVLYVTEGKDSILDYIDPESYDTKLVIYEFEISETADLFCEYFGLEKSRIIEYNEFEIERYEHLLDEYSDTLESDKIDNYNDKIKDCKKEIEEAESKIIGSSGCFVWVGYQDAIAASVGK